MSLRSLVQYLLPSEYREQVLGDLQERGFRTSDIAGVLPRIWWSYLRRVWTIPRYALASAPDATLQLRVRQFHRVRFWCAVLWFAIMYRPTTLPAPYSWIWAALLPFVVWEGRKTSLWRLCKLDGAQRSDWVEFHRKQLTPARLWGWAGYPFVMLPVGWTLVSMALDRKLWNGEGTVLLMMFPICLILGQFRASRLKRELAGLE